jgi:3-oxoacyl-[acyl-carrier protein] reductase
VQETLDAAVPELERHAAAGGGRVLCISASIKVEADAQRVIAGALEAFGRLDFLVNNGGGSPGR